jgi:SRSO17 transposase
MRKIVLAALAVAAALPATAVSAQGYYGNSNGYGSNYGSNYGRGYGNGYDRGNGYGYGRDNRVQREVRECRRELRHAENRWQYERELRECRREIAEARRHEHRRYDDRRDYRGW